MKWSRKLFAAAVALTLMVTVLPVTVCANSAAPPNLTVVVTGGPEELDIWLEGMEAGQEIINIDEDHRIWENCYRIYLSEWGTDTAGYELVVSGGGKELRFTVPAGAGDGYEDYLTVDFEKETLTLGQPVWRKPLLVGLRVVLTLLLLEGIVFLCMGYRKAVSWGLFVVINLVTQSWLNVSIAGQAFRGGYWFLMFLFMEAGIVVVESIAYAFAVKEKGKLMAVFHAIAANLLSLLLGGWMLGNLPV